MNLDKENIRKIRGIILFTGVVVLALIKFDLLWETLVFIWEILQPFVVGGMMAFVANLPMTFFEKKRKHAPAEGYVSSLRRGFSILLAYLVVVLLITLVSAAVIPQLIATVAVIAEKAPAFFQNVLLQIQRLLENNPKLLAYINEFDLQKLDWNSIMDSVVNFLKNGMGNMCISWHRRKSLESSLSVSCVRIPAKGSMTGCFMYVRFCTVISAILLSDSAPKR